MGIKGRESGELGKIDSMTVMLYKAYNERDRCNRERKPGVLQESLHCMDDRSGIHRYLHFSVQGTTCYGYA